MTAYHGDQSIKEKYLVRVAEHERLDEIYKGKYVDEKNRKFCAVGCTIHGSNHAAYETELGIPQWMAHLEDRIFEGLPMDRAKQWPKEFLDAITPGQDLEKVKIPMLIFIVESARKNFNHDRYPKTLAAIDNVLIELSKSTINIQGLIDARAAAANVAYAVNAAANAANTAHAAAHAAITAYAHPNATSQAANYAVYAADANDAAAYTGHLTVREKEFIKFADKLLELIREISPQNERPLEGI